MKTLFLFLFVTLTLNVSSQIKPIVSIESGYCDYYYKIGGTSQGYNKSDIDDYHFYSDINLGLRYKGLLLTTSVLNVFGNFQKTSFTPYQTEYILKLQYSVRNFTFGYDHMCSHPVISTLTVELRNGYRASYDKLYIKIDILK